MKNKSLLNLNKKVLIVSSWAPPKIGGAQNLYNVFSNINYGDYAILTSSKNFDGENGKFGTKLECNYYFYDSKVENSETSTKETKKKYYYLIKKFPFIFKILKNIFSFLKFFVFNLKLINKINKDGAKIVKDKKIDLLIGLSNVETNLFSTFILSKKTDKPYVIYLFDLYYGNQLSFPYNILAKFTEPIIFRNAKHILVTNDATKDYYIKKYRNEEKYSIIYNCVSPDVYVLNFPETQKNTAHKTNIVFTGNIYWAQESALNNLLNFASQTKLNLNVTIYCPNPPLNLVDKYKNIDNIKFTSASQSEMPKIQSEADILFLPLSWNTEAPDIIKTASPGKLTDYLIAGRPILIHAPDYSFIAQYAKENNFAEVVDKEDSNLLENAIQRLTEDKEYSDKLVENAKKTFYKNHNAYTNAEKITNIINNLL